MYHFDDQTKSKFTTKLQPLKNDDGTDVKMIDPRDGKEKVVYNHVDQTAGSGHGADTSRAQYYTSYVWAHRKNTYYHWVQNWLYSEDSNHEVSPCIPDYNDWN